MDPEIWDTAVVWLARFVTATAAIIVCHRGCHAAALVKRHAQFGQLFPSNCRDSGLDKQVAQMVDAALVRRFCGLLHIAKLSMALGTLCTSLSALSIVLSAWFSFTIALGCLTTLSIGRLSVVLI